MAVQAAFAQTSSGGPVTNPLLAVDAERSSPRVPNPLDPTPLVPVPLVPDPLLPERWSSPVNINTDVIRTSANYSNTPTTAFELFGLEPVRAPADGVLLYRGMLDDQE